MIGKGEELYHHAGSITSKMKWKTKCYHTAQYAGSWRLPTDEYTDTLVLLTLFYSNIPCLF